MGYSDTLKDGCKTEPTAYANRPELAGIINEKSYDYISIVNKNTGDLLGDEWAANVRHNKKYWRKHVPVTGCKGIAKNKCIIGIGASPSFHKNKDVLKYYVNRDGVRPWEDRDFITIAANHQFKPLLEMGIIPDFVICVDSANTLYDQLCKDIPKDANNTTMITGVHMSPKLVKGWTKQGRPIVFYTTGSPKIFKAFRKHMKRDPKNYKLDLGGNVMNGAFMVGVGVFGSTVFLGVGNDLSFPLSDDIEDQRSSYYADGNYSSNIAGTGSGRDEAKSHKRWAGFTLAKRHILLPKENEGHKRYNISLDLVGTSHTLWVYKTWLETTMMGQTRENAYLNYFNCTEGGILGVMAREDTDEALKDPENWFMLDEVCKNEHTGKMMYHTTTLEDGINHFLRAKRSLECQRRLTPSRLVQPVVGMENRA